MHFVLPGFRLVASYLLDRIMKNEFEYEAELSALQEENERLKSESFGDLYNAVIDERDALREELADCKRSNEIIRNQRPSEIFDQRLIAAEQRNAELEKDRDEWRTRATHRLGDCQEMMAALKEIERDTNDNDSRHLASGAVAEIIRRAKRDALKPTESGASE